MKTFLLLAVFVSSAFAPSDLHSQAGSHKTPVILIPGDGGSQVYAKYPKWDIFCPVQKDWFLIWVNLEFLFPFNEHCMRTFFKLSYNNKTRKTVNQPYVQTEVQDWGGTETVEYLDSRHYSFLVYFGKLVSTLVKNGYKRGVNIRGAPYDFRKAPNENENFVPMLKALVEDTYTRNNNTRVMLTAHSMGNLYALFFLRKMEAAWKKKFVRGFVATSAPIGGAVKSVRAMTAGDRISGILISGPVRDVLRSMPSTAFLFPSPAFWKPTEVIARRPGRNYTLSNIKQLFDDMPFPDGWEMYKDTARLVDPVWVPDLDELYCAHGLIKDTTPVVLEWGYNFEFPDFQPSVVYGDGDGTVNLRSLLGCKRWPLKEYRVYSNVDHLDTLADSRYIQDMLRILAKPDRGRL